MLCALLLADVAAHLQALTSLVANLQDLDVLAVGGLDHPTGQDKGS